MWQHIQNAIEKQLHKIMENQYQKLNKKLDILINSIPKQNKTKKAITFQPRVVNLSQVRFTKQQIQTLSLGPNYAIEREPKYYINDLIIDMELEIRQLDQKSQNIYRHLATKQIKHILANNRHNVLHKRQQHSINQIKKILNDNNLTTVKADKTKAIVIINKDKLKEKVNEFIKDNYMQLINKDPTEKYQKQIQQTIKNTDSIIDKRTCKYLTNIKPAAPKLNVYLKTHKENQPIPPVINSMQAPAYKAARYINKTLQDLINLPNTYNTKNSQELAEELTKLQINEKMKMLTLDIKDTYVNLPIEGIMQTTRFWLNKNSNNNKQLKEQTLNIIHTIIRQNYLQYDGHI